MLMMNNLMNDDLAQAHISARVKDAQNPVAVISTLPRGG